MNTRNSARGRKRRDSLNQSGTQPESGEDISDHEGVAETGTPHHGEGEVNSSAHCVLVNMEDPKDGSPPSKKIFNTEIIPEAIKPFTDRLPRITEAFVLNRHEVLVFAGRRSREEGFTFPEAEELAGRLSGSLEWIGSEMQVRSRPLTLEIGRNRIAQFNKERRREKLREKKLIPDAPFRKAKRKTLSVPESENESEVSTDKEDESDKSSDEESLTDAASLASKHSQSSSSTKASIPASRHARRKLAKQEDKGTKKVSPGKIILPYFSGDDPQDPAAVSYRTWRFRVEMFRLRGAKENSLLTKAITALRGRPADLVTSMGPNVNLSTLLKRLDSYYGDVLTLDALLHDLYAMEQKEGESVGNFGMRVEEVVEVMSQLFPDETPSEEKRRKRILDRFFHGLREDYKMSLKYLKKKPGITYQELLYEAREMEKEEQQPPKGNGHRTRREEKAQHKPWHPFATRKPYGFASASKSLKADLIQIAEAMSGESQDCKDTHPESGGEGEDPELAQVVQFMKGAVGNFKPKNPYDHLKLDQNNNSALANVECFNCGGFGHMARECPSPKLPRGSKNGKREGEQTHPSYNKSGSTDNKSAQVAATQLNHQDNQLPSAQ